MRRSLRERAYDLVIDLQGLLRSGFAGLLTQARARVGFADGREGSRWCYTERIQCSPEAIHAVDRNIDLLRQLGIPVDGPVTFPLTVPAAAERWVEDIWRREQIVDQEYTVILHPATRGETKRWPAERFAQIAINFRQASARGSFWSPPKNRSATSMKSCITCVPTPLIWRVPAACGSSPR